MPIIKETGTAFSNRLLSALPREEYDRLAPRLELVRLVPGKILYHPGDVLTSERRDAVPALDHRKRQNHSYMMGAPRTTVTTIANGLRARGLITYSRGNIRIIDRKGLEAASCEC